MSAGPPWVGDHPDPQQLQAHAARPQEARDPELEAHVQQCARCQASLESASQGEPSHSWETELLHADLTRGGTTAAISNACSPSRSNNSLPFLQPSQTPDELGRLPGYRVLELIGAGGMGVVLLAEDLQLGRRVAIKLIKSEICNDQEALQRFHKEARAVAQLEDPHIVPVHHVGQHEDAHFIVMPLLRGQPLDKLLEQQQVLPIGEVLRIGQEIALGLAAAHEHPLQFVHRDVKPKNVFVEQPSGNVRILDFGLARAAGDAKLTRSGAAVGTPAYMSPEQASGKRVDCRSDLFSLGCTLYRMSTGSLPFPGRRIEDVFLSLSQCQPAPPRRVNPSLPQELSDLILHMLRKPPEDRPASAREVANRLQSLRDSLLAGEAFPGDPAATTFNRRLAVSLLVAGAALLLAAVAWLVWLASA